MTSTIKKITGLCFAVQYILLSSGLSANTISPRVPDSKSSVIIDRQDDTKKHLVATENNSPEVYRLNYYTTQGSEYGKLGIQSLHFLWLMPLGVGSILLMPSNATSWTDTKYKSENLGQSWLDHVSRGPVIDHDSFLFNYIIHPYLGGSIYMMAMNHGLPWWQSFIYTVLISSFWEFGPEAFFEAPSLNDLIVTPTFGTVVGTLFYVAQAQLLRGGKKVFGSRFLGGVCLFAVNPIGTVLDVLQNRHPTNGYKVDSLMAPVLTMKETALYWRVEAKY